MSARLRPMAVFAVFTVRLEVGLHSRRLVFALLPALAALLLAGCATTTPPAAAPVAPIARLTPQQLAALQPQDNPALSLPEVVALSRAGTAPADIIKRLNDTGSIHVLSARQIVELSQQGVAQAVIDDMTATAEKARQSRLLTELADRDAAQAQSLAEETQRRRLAEQAFYGYGGFGYGFPGMRPGWPGYYPSPFPSYPYGYRR